MLIGLILVVFAPFVRSDVALTTLWSFNGTNGEAPECSLLQGSDGAFYGTTTAGGTNNTDSGTVFKITPQGTFSSLYSFAHLENPQAGLALGPDGNFYGPTRSGGANGIGSIFRITPGGVVTSLYSFAGTSDGAFPQTALTLGIDGAFYGTTPTGGGANGDEYGTIFKITLSGTLTVLYTFTGGLDGGGPYGPLVQASGANFYGTVYGGGVYGAGGILYTITPAGVLTVLHSFNRSNGGYSPQTGLVQGSDGNFYGTTVLSADGNGTAFKVTPTGSLTTLIDFTNRALGAEPYGGLVQGTDGNLYGTTYVFGGEGPGDGYGYYGTIFQITPSGTFTMLYSFTGADGSGPEAALVQGIDGSFYGTTSEGGTVGNGFGTVFRLTITPPATAPRFTAVTQTSDTLSLTWSTIAGTSYQLQYNSDLGTTNWTGVGSPVAATGASVSVTNSIINAAAFYRVMVLNP